MNLNQACSQMDDSQERLIRKGLKPGSWNLFADFNALLLFGDKRFYEDTLIGYRANEEIFHGDVFNGDRFGDLKSNLPMGYLCWISNYRSIIYSRRSNGIRKKGDNDQCWESYLQSEYI
jgi:hypothetical protein